MTKDKKILSWSMYDWANSSFSTTVMAGFFPVFFKSFWSEGASSVETTVRLGTAISISSLMIALITPLLGAYSDLRKTKKSSLVFFMLIGVFNCAWMYWIPAGDWTSALMAYSVAMMAFNASSVFYDSLLPSLGPASKMDYASSLGFALGYLGGGILFLLNVIMYLKPNWFGFSGAAEAVQFSFLTVAIWWFAFTWPLILNVPEPLKEIGDVNLKSSVLNTFDQLRKTILDLIQNKNLLIFVVAYWLYIDGVYTVMTMAVDYGISIGFKAENLIVALLITQFVGFPATMLYGVWMKQKGCRYPILLCLAVYSVTVVLASFMSEIWHFYALAVTIGLVQGGVQSLSRSLFAKMTPVEKSGEYFGLFNLVGKFASILGPLIVAATVSFTQKSNLGLMGLMILFLVGGFLLFKVKEPILQDDAH